MRSLAGCRCVSMTGQPYDGEKEHPGLLPDCTVTRGKSAFLSARENVSTSSQHGRPAPLSWN